MFGGIKATRAAATLAALLSLGATSAFVLDSPTASAAAATSHHVTTRPAVYRVAPGRTAPSPVIPRRLVPPATTVSKPSTTTTTTVRPPVAATVTAITTNAAPTTTTLTVATTAPTTVAPAASKGLHAAGTQLVLDGAPYKDVGVDAYELATDWGTNAGCGGMLTDTQMDAFFASLPAHSLIRFWAWQGSMAVNVHTGQIDWAPLDRVFSAAAAHGDLLIASLTSQGGECDDNVWKDPAWYSGGYTRTYGANAIGTVLPLSYYQYVRQIVTRYAASPALGMWEPVNEPEASTCPPGRSGVGCSGYQTCPDHLAAATALRSFFDTIGTEIHQLDPQGLIEAGFLGAGQCGTSGSDYQYVGASPGIDVLSYHDYYAPDVAIGGDQWNGIAVRIQQARNLDKPLVAGEMGIQAGTGAACPSDKQRQNDLAAKVDAQLQAGVDAALFWNWVPSSSANCTYDVTDGDPTKALLGTK